MIGDHCGTKFQSFSPLTGDDRCDDRCQKIEKKSQIIFFLKMMGDHFGSKFPSFFTLTDAMTGVKKLKKDNNYFLLKNSEGSLWNQIPVIFSH